MLVMRFESVLGGGITLVSCAYSLGNESHTTERASSVALCRVICVSSKSNVNAQKKLGAKTGNTILVPVECVCHLRSLRRTMRRRLIVCS